MASIKTLVPGQIVYEIRRQRMGNTTVRRNCLFKVEIVHVFEDYVIASWNGNPAQNYGLKTIKKWKVKKPEPKSIVLGMKSY